MNGCCTEIESDPQLAGQETEEIRSFLKMRRANCLKEKGQPQEALPLMIEALSDAVRSGNKVQIGRCRLGLGTVYAALGNLQAAQQRLEEAVDYCRTLHEEGGEQILGWSLLNLGRWLAKAGQPQIGISKLNEAVRILKSIHNHAGVATAYEFLGEIFESKSDKARTRENCRHAKEYYEKEGMQEKAQQMARKLQ